MADFDEELMSPSKLTKLGVYFRKGGNGDKNKENGDPNAMKSDTQSEAEDDASKEE